MGKKPKTGKDRRDKFYQLAKEQGYRARSAFKLVQLNRKYDFLSESRVLVDLCAAPGGWCQVAAKYMPVSSVIIGVDLVPIKPIKNVITMQEDITTEKCYYSLRKTLKGQEVDVVLNDGAPNVGAAWIQDAYSQSELVLYSCKLASKFLRRGGTFITKVFRSKDYNALLWVFNQLFKHVHATKPVASRMESAEIYVTCQQYMAPASIDPKLFDPKAVFQDLDAPVAATDVFSQLKSSQKRHREGYDSTMPVHLHTTIDAADFVRNPDAPIVLGQYSTIGFESNLAQLFLKLLKTTPEVKAMCQDLKVLNKKDFKVLLRWRMQMQKVIELQEREAEAHSDLESLSGEESEGESDKEEESISRELEHLSAKKKAELKRSKRKAQKTAAKFKQRVALQMEMPSVDVNEADNTEQLFTHPKGEMLNEIPLELVDEIDLDDDKWVEEEEEELEYDEAVERDLDMAYEQYKAARSSDQHGDDDLFVTPNKADPIFVPDLTKGMFEGEDEGEDKSGSDEESDEEEEESVFDVGQQSTLQAPSRRAALWFASEEFENSDDEEDEEEESEKEEEEEKRPKKRVKTGTGYVALPDSWDIRRGDDDADADAADKGKGRKSAGKGIIDDDDDDEMEIVPLKGDDDSSSEDEDEDEDDAVVPVDETELLQRSKKAREQRVVSLALGRYMTNKKASNRLIDESYNRYVHDDEGLPGWFTEEEQPHRRPQLPVTKQMIEDARQRMATINARPIAKVAEAKGRARMKAVRRQKRLEKRASDLQQNADLTAGDKAREMERLVKAANKGGRTAQRRKQKVLVKTKSFKAGSGKVAYGTKPVDSRMRKDKRNEQKAARRAKGRGNGKKRRRGR